MFLDRIARLLERFGIAGAPPREIDITPGDRVVFFHIPRTAGITFGSVVDQLFSGLPRFPEYIQEKLVALSPEEISQYRLFMGHFLYNLFDVMFPGRFVGLTFLREPVARTVSSYQHLLRQDSLGGPLDSELEQVKRMTLHQFATDTSTHLAMDMIDLQTRYLGESDDGRPVGSEPGDESGLSPDAGAYLKQISHSMNEEIPAVGERALPTELDLKRAKQRLQNLAFFGMTERFQESLFLLSYAFGWRPILDEVRLNASPSQDRSKPLERETRAAIESRVGLDQQLYQFALDAFDRRYRQMTKWLARRYGDQRIRRFSGPLALEDMAWLLERHYEARREARLRRSPPVNPAYTYRLTAPCEGAYGWHAIESLPVHGATRWSGPGLESGMDLPRPPGSQIQITFRVLLALAPDVIQGISLKVNGVPIPLGSVVDHAGATVFTGRIPPAAATGAFLRIVFTAPRTIAPYTLRPHNVDDRRLGFQLNWIRLIALPGSQI
ncbi:MAG TPA: hypothetical protein VFH29_09340 [Anaerolineales bacterium]|nr:hypothetical protein [Anaerolineales bacterium]